MSLYTKCLNFVLLLFCRKRAARDYNRAMVLFQVLLENLDIQHSRFVQEESFLQQHNIRRYKQNFQVCKTKTELNSIFVLHQKYNPDTEILLEYQEHSQITWKLHSYCNSNAGYGNIF